MTQRRRTPGTGTPSARRGRRQLAEEIAAFSALAILLVAALVIILPLG